MVTEVTVDALALQSSQLLKDLDNIFRQQFSNITKAYMEADQGLHQAAQASIEAIKTINWVAERTVQLAAYGWTIPMLANFTEIRSLIERSTDEASTDAAFVEFYTSDGSTKLRRLHESLLSEDELKDWRPLLKEAIFCLKHSKYRSCVASLLPLIEGVLANKPNWNDDGEKKAFFDAKLKSIPPKSTLKRAKWLSIQKFFDGLTVSIKFKDLKNKPTRLNRHWILHGRDIPSGELSDCIRLLQALDTISG